MNKAIESISRKHKPYSEYKDSGIEWLGKIPKNWKFQKLKYISSVNISNVDKKSVEGEQPIQLCNYVDVYYNDIITLDIEFMKASASQEQINKFSLKTGDVIITKDSESWEDIAVSAYVPSDIKGVICGYHLAQLRSNPDYINGKYLFRALVSCGINDQFRVAANGITRYGLSKYWIYNSLFPVPPIEEQLTINNFLDRETAKIDAMIAKKERLISLLEEKRIALISHYVTKGLDPNAPMKDSGIPWIGKIPKHWEVQKLKHIAIITLSNVDKKSIEGEQPIKLCNYIDVYYNDFITSDIEFMKASASQEQINKFSLKAGDVIITKDSESWEDIAISAYVPSDIEGVICGYHLAQIRTNSTLIDGKYLFRSFQARGINDQFRVAANGITRYGLGK